MFLWHIFGPLGAKKLRESEVAKKMSSIERIKICKGYVDAVQNIQNISDKKDLK